MDECGQRTELCPGTDLFAARMYPYCASTIKQTHALHLRRRLCCNELKFVRCGTSRRRVMRLMMKIGAKQVQRDQALSAVFRHFSSASISNGFLSKQTAPLATALASRSGSVRAVIIITGTAEPRFVSSRLRSRPLMPGI